MNFAKEIDMANRMNKVIYDDEFHQCLRGVCHHDHPLGEWLRGIYSDLDRSQKIAWLELMVLAETSHCYGAQVNYISSEQIAALLCVDEDVLEGILEVGHAHGKVDVQEKAIVPVPAFRLERHDLKSGGPTWGSKSEVNLSGTTVCAKYRSLVFPGMFWYVDKGTGYQSKRKDASHIGDDEKREVNSVLLEACDLLRQRLWSRCYSVPSKDIIDQNPIDFLAAEDLPESVFFVDEDALATRWSVEDYDKALSIWNYEPLEIAELLHMTRERMPGDLLSRPFGAPLTCRLGQ
jgi:hypothetical protein